MCVLAFLSQISKKEKKLKRSQNNIHSPQYPECILINPIKFSVKKNR